MQKTVEHLLSTLMESPDNTQCAIVDELTTLFASFGGKGAGSGSGGGSTAAQDFDTAMWLTMRDGGELTGSTVGADRQSSMQCSHVLLCITLPQSLLT